MIPSRILCIVLFAVMTNLHAALPDGSTDFDFEFGDWKASLKRRLDPLTEVGIGLAGDRDLGDPRVLEQHDLDLAGADLVAAALAQVC